MNAALRAPAQARPVLIVDDEAPMRAALSSNFERRGWLAQCASGKSEALARLRQRSPALVVTDFRMPDGDGFEVLRAARALSPPTAVILLTAFGTVPGAVEAMKLGACEYLTKPIVFDQLLDAAARVLPQAGVNDDGGPAIIGSSPLLLRVLEKARQAALSDADVLIEAESGTGKELLARRIHLLSSRAARPFVAVNCAALPESLLESELFGHSRGSFTGAICAQAGKFQLAQGGTLLLDEIGEMPLNLQPKLLRVLQEREYYPLGANHPVKLDVRVIATTNRCLVEMVADGKFRADLYYRLNVIALTLPALRERSEDIRPLAEHFAACFSSEGRFLSEEFLCLLERRTWAGNVRELANTVRRALALGETEAAAIGPPMPSHAAWPSRTANIPVSFPVRPSQAAAQLCPGMSLGAAEKRLLELTLTATGGNRSRAAEMLGVSLRTVRNKIRQYHLPARSDYVHD